MTLPGEKGQINLLNDLLTRRILKGDPFNDQITTSRTNLVDLLSVHGLSEFDDITNTTNSGSVSEDSNDQGEIEMETGTTSNSQAEVRTAQRTDYTSGFSAQTGSGVRIVELPEGEEELWTGPFEQGENGIIIGIDSTSAFVARYKNGGIVEKIRPDDWNGENFEPNRYAEQDAELGLDYTQLIVTQTRYPWYGGGNIEIFALCTDTKENDSNRLCKIHNLRVEAPEPTILNPNQPLTILAQNQGSSSNLQVRLTGREISIVGPDSRDSRVTPVTMQNNVTVNDGSWTYLFSAKRKDSNVDVGARINDLKFLQATSGIVEVGIFIDPDLSGTNYGSVADVKDKETAFEFDESGSISDISAGNKVFSSFGAAADQVFSGGASSTKATLTDKNIPEQQPVVVAAKGIGSTPDLRATLDIKEFQ